MGGQGLGPAASTVGGEGDLHLFAGNDLGVQNGRGVVAGVAPADGVADDALAQKAVGVAPANALVHRFPQVAAGKVDVLSDLQKHAGHAGVLTDGNAFPVGDLVIFHDVIQYAHGDVAILTGTAGFDGALHVIGEVGIGFDTQPLHSIGDPADRNFSHMFSFFPLMAGIMGKLCRRKSLPVTSLRPL